MFFVGIEEDLRLIFFKYFKNLEFRGLGVVVGIFVVIVIFVEVFDLKYN